MKKLVVIETKICRVCRKFLPLTMFSVDRRARDGKSAICRMCRSERTRKEYARIKADPELYRARLEYSRESTKRWRERHGIKLKGITVVPEHGDDVGWCSRCKRLLPLSSFNPSRTRRGGQKIQGYCKVCAIEAVRERKARKRAEQAEQGT